MPIGFLPGGGTSVLPRALGLPRIRSRRRGNGRRDPRRAHAPHLPRPVNGRRFSFAAGVGIDAEAVRRVDQMGREQDGKRPGDLAFARAIVASIAANRGHVDADLEVAGFGRAAFAFVANGNPYTYARNIPMPLVPDADFELGLDFVAPVRIRRRSLLWTTYALLAGIRGPRAFTSATISTGSRSAATVRCRSRSTARTRRHRGSGVRGGARRRVRPGLSNLSPWRRWRSSSYGASSTRSAKSTGSAPTTCSRSTARSSSCARTTSAR